VHHVPNGGALGGEEAQAAALERQPRLLELRRNAVDENRGRSHRGRRAAQDDRGEEHDSTERDEQHQEHEDSAASGHEGLLDVDWGWCRPRVYAAGRRSKGGGLEDSAVAPRGAKADAPSARSARGGDEIKRGGVLLSHSVSRAVPSALEGLTSLFGMGRGVTPPLPPHQLI